MLGAELVDVHHSAHAYVPAHFPPLPSQHSWKQTPVYTERENDPRKIRERATQEGILAEQALRKLTSANNPRAAQHQQTSKVEMDREALWNATLVDVMDGIEDQKGSEGDIVLDGSVTALGVENTKVAEILKATGGMVVNHDRAHWRKTAPAGGVRARQMEKA